jgi:hypothetical protein
MVSKIFELWVEWLGSDSAVVVPIPGHADVALLTPIGVPRVFHDPKLLSYGVVAKADCQNRVVQRLGLVATQWLKVHTYKFS